MKTTKQDIEKISHEIITELVDKTVENTENHKFTSQFKDIYN